MKVAVVYNRDYSGVINVMNVQNREAYDPKTVEAVAAALEAGGHNVRLIDGNMHVIERLREFMPRVMAGERPGMVFNMAYGIQGVSRYTHLPAMLEMLGVPYVGSNPEAHALALDKVIAKLIFQSQGVPTPRFWNFATPDDRYDDLCFPAVVKPKMEGMSLGIMAVHDEHELRDAVSRVIREFSQHVLVEQLVAGREFTVGLLGNGDVEALPVVELDLQGDPQRIRNDEGRNPLRKLCPAPLSPAQTEQLQTIARQAFLAVGLNDYGRIDVRMDEQGNPYVLEINSMADLGRDGAYVCSAEQAGYSFEALINRILNVAAVRYFGNGAFEETAAKAGVKAHAAAPESLPAKVRGFLRSQTITIDDSVETLAELQSPADIAESLQAQLRLVGFRRVDKSKWTNIALFANHSHRQHDVLLVALARTARATHGVRRSEDGSRIYDAQVVDSLGGLVVLLSAVRALRFARELRHIRCGVMLVLGDIAKPGQTALQRLVRQSRYVLGLQASDLDGSLILSRLGEAHYQLQAEYVTRNGASPSAETALSLLCRKLPDIQKLSNLKVGRQVSFSRVDFRSPFGQQSAMTEAECIAQFSTPAQGDLLDRRIRAIASQGATAGVTYKVSDGLRIPPLVESKATRQLYQKVERVGKASNFSVPAIHGAAASSLNATLDGAACLDGFGPRAGVDQVNDQPFIVRDSLLDRATLLALTMHHLADQKKAR